MHPSEPYASNPFRTVIEGLSRVLRTNGLELLKLLGLVVTSVIVLYVLFGVIIGASFIASPVLMLIPVALVAFLWVLVRLGAAELQLWSADARDEPMKWRTAWRTGSRFGWRILGLGLLLWLIVSVALVVFIVPGIYLGGRLALAFPAMICEDLGVGAALSRSWQLTRGRTVEVLGALAAAVIVGSSGFIGQLSMSSAVFGRYRQFINASHRGTKVSWVNWVLVIAVTLVGLGIIALYGYLAYLSLTDPNFKTSP